MPVTQSGLVETQARLKAFGQGLKDESLASMNLMTNQFSSAVKTYPPIRSTSYVRTGYYYQTVTDKVVDSLDNKVVGYITEGAPYSKWLRGLPDGSYRQAWMHVGFWQPLVDMLETYAPQWVKLVTDRINALKTRIFG